MKYAKIEDIKKSLNIKDWKNDELIQRLIDAVSKAFDKYIWYNLGVRTYGQILKNNTWENVLFPSYSPIKGINELKEEGKNVKIKKIIDDIIYLEESVFGDVFIEYEAWYSDLSEIKDVEEACIKTALNLYKVYIQWWEVRNKSIDGINISYIEAKTNKEDLLDVKNILDQYKIKNYNLI